jgi:hypothetical protein
MSKHLLLIHNIDINEEKQEKTISNLKTMLMSLYPYNKDSIQYQKRLDAVVDFIIRTGQPLSLIDNPKFIKMLSMFDNKFRLPSRNTDIIDNKFNQFQTHIIEQLKKVDFCSITTNGWSSNSNQSFMGVTVHFVDQNFVFKSYQIALKFTPESHTSEYLKRELEEVFFKYGIQTKVFSGSSDTANNIKHTLNDLMPQLIYVPCFCHVLNLIVKDVVFDDVSSVSNLLSKCRRLVGAFRHSNVLSEKLKSYQSKNNLPVKKLKQEVVTRCNSSYLMSQSIIDTYQAVFFVCNNNDDTEYLFSSDEYELIKKLVSFLEPMYYLTNQLSNEKFPPCSLVIPAIEKVLIHYKEKEQASSNDLVLKCKEHYRICIEISPQYIFKRISFERIIFIVMFYPC